MHARSDDTSYWSRSATCSIPEYMVGTPSNTVTWSRPIICSAVAPSKRGRSVRHEPDSTDAFSPQVSPNTWNSGRQPITTSSGVISSRVRAAVRALVSRLAWVSSAPLGEPVVPEV